MSDAGTIQVRETQHAGAAAIDGHRQLRALTQGEQRSEIGLTLLLREHPSAAPLERTLRWLDAQPPRQRRHLDGRALAERHGYAAHDAAAVAHWAAESGLRVTAVDPATRRIALHGEATRAAAAFGVTLGRFSGPGPAGDTVEYRGHPGAVVVPERLRHIVDGVFGLDDRPVGRPHLRLAAAPPQTSYDPSRLARVYEFPRLERGGQGLQLVAGMVELGGVVHSHDVARAFERLGLRAPEIIEVNVDGALPRSDPDGADVEIALDYQVLGAMVAEQAPQARLTIVIYNAPNTERGFIDAVATAATDAVRRPAAVSISWGAPENGWTVQAMRAMDAAFAVGAAHGVAFTASSGDWGSANLESDGRQHAEHPASSPNVWACGGTTLLVAGSRVIGETVWNELAVDQGAAGSGVSRLFPPPRPHVVNGILARDADDGRAGRGLPDGSGNADPLTGWNIVALDRLRTTGGTSAVAPMYAALFTLVAAQTGRPVGAPHASLYGSRGRAFNDVTRGNTGGPYQARPGWDPASGWGSPIGYRVARELDRGACLEPPARPPHVERRRLGRADRALV